MIVKFWVGFIDEMSLLFFDLYSLHIQGNMHVYNQVEFHLTSLSVDAMYKILYLTTPLSHPISYQMSHVRLTDLSEHDADFGADLIRNPLRFGFVDGKIVSVCPADDEPRWALNFKRAVLSTFQNSMFDFNSVNKVRISIIFWSSR